LRRDEAATAQAGLTAIFNSISTCHSCAGASQIHIESISLLKSARIYNDSMTISAAFNGAMWWQTFAPQSPTGKTNFRSPEADFSI
jgi:hypothetical protein